MIELAEWLPIIIEPDDDTDLSEDYLFGREIQREADQTFYQQALDKIAELKAERDTAVKAVKDRPKIVCLCGSVKFADAFEEANVTETLNGNIILSIGCNMKTDKRFELQSIKQQTETKNKLDELHKRKIDLADEVLILNVGGYIGESTRSELEYAIAHNKVVRYLKPVQKGGNR